MATINLTVGDDSYSDNNQGNRINAFAGDDRVLGNGGDDRIYGGRGSDELFGGDGNDRLFESAVTEDEAGTIDQLIGGAGADLFDVRQGTNEFGRVNATGGIGDDTLLVARGAATVLGGDGDDLVRLEVNVVGTVRGGAGDDRIDARVNDGTLDVAGGDGGDSIVLRSPIAVFEGFGAAFGGAGNDTIDARNLSEGVLDGGGGADVIFAADDEALLFGGTGADRLVGRDREDSTEAQGGVDTFGYREADFAGAGSDRIEGFERGIDRIDVSAVDAEPQTLRNDAFDFVGQDATPGIGELGFSRSGSDTLVALNFGGGIEQLRLAGLNEPVDADDFVL